MKPGDLVRLQLIGVTGIVAYHDLEIPKSFDKQVWNGLGPEYNGRVVLKLGEQWKSTGLYIKILLDNAVRYVHCGYVGPYDG